MANTYLTGRWIGCGFKSNNNKRILLIGRLGAAEVPLGVGFGLSLGVGSMWGGE